MSTKKPWHCRIGLHDWETLDIDDVKFPLHIPPYKRKGRRQSINLRGRQRVLSNAVCMLCGKIDNSLQRGWLEANEEAREKARRREIARRIFEKEAPCP